MSGENKPLTREGLTAYFKQAPSEKGEQRTDWDIDTLVTLFLNADFDARKAGRRDLARELRKWVSMQIAFNKDGPVTMVLESVLEKLDKLQPDELTTAPNLRTTLPD